MALMARCILRARHRSHLDFGEELTQPGPPRLAHRGGDLRFHRRAETGAVDLPANVWIEGGLEQTTET